METETKLVWHRVRRDGSFLFGGPHGKSRDVLAITCWATSSPCIEVLHWFNGDADYGVERGFYSFGSPHVSKRSDSAIVAWAEFPTVDEVLTDGEKELYE